AQRPPTAPNGLPQAQERYPALQGREIPVPLQRVAILLPLLLDPVQEAKLDGREPGLQVRVPPAGGFGQSVVRPSDSIPQPLQETLVVLRAAPRRPIVNRPGDVLVDRPDQAVARPPPPPLPVHNHLGAVDPALSNGPKALRLKPELLRCNAKAVPPHDE